MEFFQLQQQPCRHHRHWMGELQRCSCVSLCTTRHDSPRTSHGAGENTSFSSSSFEEEEEKELQFKLDRKYLSYWRERPFVCPSRSISRQLNNPGSVAHSQSESDKTLFLQRCMKGNYPDYYYNLDLFQIKTSLSSPHSWSRQMLKIQPPRVPFSTVSPSENSATREEEDQSVHPPIWRIVVPVSEDHCDTAMGKSGNDDHNDDNHDDAEEDGQLLLAPSIRRHLRERFHVDAKTARSAFQQGISRDVLQALLGKGAWDLLESDSEVEFV